MRKIESLLKRVKLSLDCFLRPDSLYIYRKDIYENHCITFSQEGEDILLKEYFLHRPKGFYVDVGSHHPQRLSNTYLLYLKGWRGINIDAMPGSMAAFERIRPRDINLELAVFDAPEANQKLTFYEFAEPALNTFSSELAEIRQTKGACLCQKKEITVHRLADILDAYLPQGQTIDILNIDVEGLDLNVLMSNNWNKYRPEIILFEELDVLNSSKESVNKVSALRYLEAQGYELFAKLPRTCIVKRK